MTESMPSRIRVDDATSTTESTSRLRTSHTSPATRVIVSPVRLLCASCGGRAQESEPFRRGHSQVEDGLLPEPTQVIGAEGKAPRGARNGQKRENLAPARPSLSRTLDRTSFDFFIGCLLCWLFARSNPERELSTATQDPDLGIAPDG